MLLVIFGVFGVANIVAAATSNVTLDWLTKPFLMPLLALWVWRKAPKEKGIIAALLFSWAGDVALQFEGTLPFITGMALFLGAHICYITTFVQNGARPRLGAVALYAAILVGALIWLWQGLGALAVPMTVYGLALATTATLAASINRWVAVGGGLFLISDLLIAVRVAEAAKIPGPPIWVMLTYVAAQLLIATGWVRYRQARD